MTDLSTVPLAVGYPTASLVAAVAVGLLAGAATYALLAVTDLWDAPPRRIAATVVRRPGGGTLSPLGVALAHLAWAVAVLVVVWAGGLALGRLGTDLPSAAVGVTALAVSWWLLTGPLLSRGGSSDAAGGDDADGHFIRREWALVHAALALAALLAFPAVYYLLLTVVFPPSG